MQTGMAAGDIEILGSLGQAYTLRQVSKQCGFHSGFRVWG